MDDLQRELEQLRESHRSIRAEKSALQQQLAYQEEVTRIATAENDRLATDLQRRERAVQQLERLQHQYDRVVQICDDNLYMTGPKLGAGAYGEVDVGMWCGVAVAVKTFHDEPVRITDLNISFIRREVSVSSRVHHPNIISICGAIIENDVPLRIVMELLEGSLKDVINAAFKPTYLSMREQVDIAAGCLSGLMYLHQLQPSLLHGDIRTTNILMTKTMEAKIGDLGSCRFSNESLSVGPLSPEYIAPERMAKEGRGPASANTTQGDMYSLGVTLAELFTGVAAERKIRDYQFQRIRHVELQDLCYAMAEENPDDRISAAVALVQVNAVKQNDEYTSCPPKRMVKGKKRNEDQVTLIDMPWM